MAAETDVGENRPYFGLKKLVIRRMKRVRREHHHQRK
jgi:hypothetical protein